MLQPSLLEASGKKLPHPASVRTILVLDQWPPAGISLRRLAPSARWGRSQPSVQRRRHESCSAWTKEWGEGSVLQTQDPSLLMFCDDAGVEMLNVVANSARNRKRMVDPSQFIRVARIIGAVQIGRHSLLAASKFAAQSARSFAEVVILHVRTSSRQRSPCRQLCF